MVVSHADLGISLSESSTPTRTMRRRKRATMARAFVQSDGRTVALFPGTVATSVSPSASEIEQSVSHTAAIVLESSGGCFVHIDACGGVKRQLTRYATSETRDLVLEAILFRNMHHVDIPYVCDWIAPYYGGFGK